MRHYKYIVSVLDTYWNDEKVNATIPSPTALAAEPSVKPYLLDFRMVTAPNAQRLETMVKQNGAGNWQQSQKMDAAREDNIPTITAEQFFHMIG